MRRIQRRNRLESATGHRRTLARGNWPTREPQAPPSSAECRWPPRWRGIVRREQGGVEYLMGLRNESSPRDSFVPRSTDSVAARPSDEPAVVITAPDDNCSRCGVPGSMGTKDSLLIGRTYQRDLNLGRIPRWDGVVAA